MLVCTSVCAHAQKKGPEEPVRYVRMKADGGSYLNNGKSWDKAKDKVQDAINDLRDYMQQNGLTSGSVYIAAGEYVPTESTESSGGSMLNTSFKIYAGIHVYGGFNPDSLESKPGDRIMSNGKKVSDNWADQSGIGTTSGTEIASQWDLKYKTILSGNHATTPVTFEFDSIHSRFNTAFLPAHTTLYGSRRTAPLIRARMILSRVTISRWIIRLHWTAALSRAETPRRVTRQPVSTQRTAEVSIWWATARCAHVRWSAATRRCAAAVSMRTVVVR